MWYTIYAIHFFMKHINEIQYNGLLWVNITKPEEKILKSVQKRFGLNDQEVKESMPSFQRPKFIKRDNYYFLVLHFPVFDRVSRRLGFTEVDFFLSGTSLITVHDNSLPVLEDFFAQCAKKAEAQNAFFKGTAAHVFFELLNRLLESIFPILLHVNEDISSIDKILFTRIPDRKMAEEILRLKMNVTNFRRAMQSHKTVMDRLVSMGGRDLDLASYQIYINTVRDHINDIWHTLESQKESADTLDETNESVVGLRMNEIMKTLTIISVTTFPLTLITTIFAVHAGGTPFVEHPYGFWIISGMTLIGALAMILVFKVKKWMD